MQSQTPNRYYEVKLSFSREQILQIYRGSAKAARARSRCGLVIQIPAERLMPLLDHLGVHGWFRLTVSGDSRLIGIERIG